MLNLRDGDCCNGIGKDVKIALLYVNKRFFRIAPLAHAKFFQNDDKINLHMMIAQVTAQLQDEEALFADLCRKRFKEAVLQCETKGG